MTWRRPTGRSALGLAGVLLLAAGCTSQQTATTSPASPTGGNSGPRGAVAEAAQSPQNNEVQQLLFLGDQYRSSGLPAKAAEQYRKALEMAPEDVDIYPRLGYALVEAEDFDQAVRVYQRYVDLRPKDCNSHASLGFAYLRMEMADQAIVAYEKALALCSDDPNAYSNLGKAYIAGGYEIEAIEAFRRAVELNPTDVLSYEKLAELQWNRKLFPEAIAIYEAILSMPDHGKSDQWVAWASGRIATGYKWAGAFAKAIPFYRAQLADDPTHVGAIKGLAQAYEETQQTDQAIRLYTDLIKAKSDTPGYYYHLADLLNEVGRHQDAIRVVKEGQKYDEGCPAYGYYVTGIAYEKLGGVPNFKRAKREFKKCVDCGDPQLSESARKQMERQDQLIKIEDLKRKKAESGY
jgi:tetratricopeptide (TPR) repeat protein